MKVAKGEAWNSFQYTGAPYSEQAGLLHLAARHYNPAIGRFLSQDTYKGDPWQPWTQNLYSYVGNNPVNYVDPTGHRAVADAGGGLGGPIAIPIPAPAPAPTTADVPSALTKLISVVGAGLGTLIGALASGGTQTATSSTSTPEKPITIVDANIAITFAKAMTDPNSLNANEIARLTMATGLGTPLFVTPTAAAETRNNVLPIAVPNLAALPEYSTVLAQMTANKVGGSKDQNIVTQAVLTVSTGGTVRFATADHKIINALYRMSGGDPAKSGGAQYQPFTVNIAGRTLQVIPFNP